MTIRMSQTFKQKAKEMVFVSIRVSFLRDPKKKELMLAKIGLNDDAITRTQESSGKEDGMSNDSNSSQHLIPSGMSAGAWSMPPPPLGSW